MFNFNKMIILDVDLEVFKSFNKLKALTEDINVIAAAVSKSNILEVSKYFWRQI